MQKRTMLKRIRTIIEDCGMFGAGEVEGNQGQPICIAQMGSLIGLAEYFYSDHAMIEVYDTSSSNSDTIHSYEMDYRDMTKDEVKEILDICEMYELEQINAN